MARTLVVGPYTFTFSDQPLSSADSANWQENNGFSGTVSIRSNACAGGGLIADCSWKGAGTFTDDQYFEGALVGAFTGSDADSVGGNLRNNGGGYGGSPTNSCYRVVWAPALNSQAGAAQVFKVVNGNASNVGTQLGANINFGMATNDLLSAEAVTNGANVDINVYKNGVLQGTRSDTSSVLTGGKPGVSGLRSAEVLRIDDWTAGNVTSASFVGNRRSGLCAGTSNVEIGRASGSVFRKNSWGLLVPAWSM